MQNKIYVAARLRSEDVAEILKCKPQDVATLVAAKLLKPLGNPRNNATKYFSAAELDKKISEENWLSKITNAMYVATNLKNGRRRANVIQFKKGEEVA